MISNASSDDYCVVPLPDCFNPDIPLDSGDFATVEPPASVMVERDALLEPLVEQQNLSEQENIVSVL